LLQGCSVALLSRNLEKLTAFKDELQQLGATGDLRVVEVCKGARSSAHMHTPEFHMQQLVLC
jgi:NADP-dependent 3-hydroxy acid dehydrogenase YdfG